MTGASLFDQDDDGSQLQAIARIFRFGQEHPTHVYRIMAKNTFGHRVYRRSVDKESLFKRVIDKRHIKGGCQDPSLNVLKALGQPCIVDRPVALLDARSKS